MQRTGARKDDEGRLAAQLCVRIRTNTFVETGVTFSTTARIKREKRTGGRGKKKKKKKAHPGRRASRSRPPRASRRGPSARCAHERGEGAFSVTVLNTGDTTHPITPRVLRHDPILRGDRFPGFFPGIRGAAAFLSRSAVGHIQSESDCREQCI